MTVSPVSRIRGPRSTATKPAAGWSRTIGRRLRGVGAAQCPGAPPAAVAAPCSRAPSRHGCGTLHEAQRPADERSSSSFQDERWPQGQQWFSSDRSSGEGQATLRGAPVGLDDSSRQYVERSRKPPKRRAARAGTPIAQSGRMRAHSRIVTVAATLLLGFVACTPPEEEELEPVADTTAAMIHYCPDGEPPPCAPD